MHAINHSHICILQLSEDVFELRNDSPQYKSPFNNNERSKWVYENPDGVIIHD